MTGKYEFAFDESSVYAKVRDCLVAVARTGTVLDLGCGFGALAEISRAHGLSYVGADLDSEGLVDLERRGFGTHSIDLTDLDAVEALLTKVASDGPISAVLLLDTLEHLPEPWRLLRLLSDNAHRWGTPALVVSIPNVTHLDVVSKLLAGRWDSTPTGLLDSTHLQMFSGRRVDEVLRTSGWVEVERADFKLTHSDQHFPDGLPMLVNGTPLRELLRAVRTDADEHGYVNQFVRAYVPAPAGEPASAPPVADEPFLSILVRTRGDRPESLRDLLLCLAAQHDEDHEVLLLAHGVEPDVLSELSVLLHQQEPRVQQRTRLIPVEPGGGRSRPLNVGVEQARGRYVAVVDDDDVVTATYVSAFKAVAAGNPGHVLRAVVVEQDVAETSWNGLPGFAATSVFRYPYPRDYDLTRHTSENYTPFCGLAFPSALFRELGYRFDESLAVLEDWELQLRSAQVCGVAATPEITSVYHRWASGSGNNSNALHTDEHWTAARVRVIEMMDARPMVLPPGSFSRLREIQTEVDVRAAQIDQLHAEVQRLHAVIDEIKDSQTWRVAKALGSGVTRARRITRR